MFETVEKQKDVIRTREIFPGKCLTVFIFSNFLWEKHGNFEKQLFTYTLRQVTYQIDVPFIAIETFFDLKFCFSGKTKKNSHHILTITFSILFRIRNKLIQS